MIHEEIKDLFVSQGEEESDADLDPTEFDADLEDPETLEEGEDDVEDPDQGMLEGDEDDDDEFTEESEEGEVEEEEEEGGEY